MPKKKSTLVFSRYLFFIIYTAAVLTGVYLCRESALQRIGLQEAKKIKARLHSVLPAFDNQPWEEAFDIENHRIFPARSQQTLRLDPSSPPITANVLTGFAMILQARDGEGLNSFLAGLDLEGRVKAVEPEFKRKSEVPENFMTPQIADEATAFFESRRALFFEKANEMKETAP